MKNIFYLLLILVFSTCLSLDDNLYTNDNSITEYKLDKYEGHIEIDLDESYDIPEEDIHLMSLQSHLDGDDVKIWAIYIGKIENIATDTIIMYCHGNADHMDNYWDRAKLLYHSGNEKGRYGVMMVDYRGYGLSEGKPIESGLKMDVEAALEWLESNGLTGDRLAIYGYSLGSIPAVAHAAAPIHLTPYCLILENPIGSIATMAQDASTLSMSPSFFTDLKTNNIELIKSVNQPLLWFGAEDDTFLSAKTHGQKIYDNHKGKFKEFIIVPKAVHSDLPKVMGYKAYAEKMGKFLRRNE